MLPSHLLSISIQAAGLATMISTMRPDIDNMDEYVRNTTARAFAVVSSALGIPSLLPFLKVIHFTLLLIKLINLALRVNILY